MWTTGPEQITDTNSRQLGHLRLGCATHLLSEVSDIGTSSLLLLLSRRLQLPLRLQSSLARSAPVACHNRLPSLAWYATRKSADYCARQDITIPKLSAIPELATCKVPVAVLPIWCDQSRECNHIGPNTQSISSASYRPLLQNILKQ